MRLRISGNASRIRRQLGWRLLIAVLILVLVGCEPLDTMPTVVPAVTGSVPATPTPVPITALSTTVAPVGTLVLVATVTTVPTATSAPRATNVLVATPVPTAPTAAPSGTVQVVVVSESGSPGELVTVEITVLDPIGASTPQGSGVGSAQILVTYDSTRVFARSASSVLSGSISNIGRAGEVVLSSASLGGNSLVAGDSLLSIEFEIANGSPSGNVPIIVTALILTDTAAPPTNIPTTLTNGEIAVR